jgi:hypothetical protein
MTLAAARVEAGAQSRGDGSLSGQGSSFGGGSGFTGGRPPGTIDYWGGWGLGAPAGMPRITTGGFLGFGFPSPHEKFGLGWPGFSYGIDFMGQRRPNPFLAPPPKK